METLDNPRATIDPDSVPVFPPAIRAGLIIGLVLIVYTLLGNMLGFARPSAGFLVMIVNGLVVFGLYIAYMVISLRKFRNGELGGYISFGKAFMFCFILVMTATVISSVFNYVYMNFIEPDYLENIVSEMAGMFESMGLSDDQIEQAMADTKAQTEASMGVVSTILYGTISGAIISLIIALIMKRKPPMEVY